MSRVVHVKWIRTLLSRRLLDLRCRSVPHQPIMRLELLQHLMAVVDESEPRALTPTVLGAETEAGDLVLVGFVEFGELGAEFVFRDVGAVGVEDVTRASR